jgi:hypothetical protein
LLELGLRAADSGSPLLAWHALRACEFAEEYCPFAHQEQDLLEADRDNAEAWAVAATLRYRRGDVAGALTAMQEAGRASTSTWYWTETTALAERVIQEQLATAYPDFVGSGLVAVAALPGATSYQLCQDVSATSRAWAQACLAFGALRGELNETMAARGLAYSMRRRALLALGDTEAAEEVAREYELDRNLGAMGVWQALLMTDAERLHAYLGAVQEHGESEGRRVFLRQELPLLMQRAGMLERESAKECAAQSFDVPTAVGTLSATFRDYLIEDYPVQVGDRLRISVSGSSGQSHEVGPDGVIATWRVPDIAVVGKTTGQIEQEIAAVLSARNNQPTEVFVILMSSPSPEELRLEFDDALKEAAARREVTR